MLQPSAALTQLTTVLFGIEDRAKLYYISGGKTGGARPTPTPDGDDDDDPTPSPTPDPSGGGDE